MPLSQKRALLVGKKSIGWSALMIALSLLITSCGLPTGNERPEDKKLREGVLLLMTSYQKYHPKNINYEMAKVKAQISKPLPKGEATEAGWTLRWVNSIPGELPVVTIPWVILGQYPNHYVQQATLYSGGNTVPQAIALQIAKAQQPEDEFFSAVVNQRISAINPKWIIYTANPYLPVTDPGYGFATNINGNWKIVDFGTAQVGCRLVPAEVQSEFGFTCP